MSVRRLQAELVLDAGAQLAEGPVWDPRFEELLWVDAPRGEIHAWDPDGADRIIVTLDTPVGSVGWRAQSEGLIAACGRGFAFVERDGTVEVVDPVADDVRWRMNDGACDRAGRFLAGVVSTRSPREPGRLLRLGTDRASTCVLDGVGMSNGVDWSPDDRRLYHVDTDAGTLSAFEYDGVAGPVGDREVLFELHRDEGLPDGLCVDAQGAIWLAVWGAGHVLRLTPGGRLDAVVEVRAKNVTSCELVGDTLYITSARARDAPAGDRGGSLFAARAGVAGGAPRGFSG